MERSDIAVKQNDDCMKTLEISDSYHYNLEPHQTRLYKLRNH